MPQIAIPYASLSIGQLVAIHNALAPERGETRLTSWHESRCLLAQRVAILRTKKPLPPPEEPKKRPVGRPKKRNQPIRDAIMEALAFVSHYEDVKTGSIVRKRDAARYRRAGRKIVSVGLPYSECVIRVRRKFPGMSPCSGKFRVIATRVRDKEAGYETCKLPHKRPHGTKGKRK